MKDYKCTRKKEVKVGAKCKNICDEAPLWGYEGEIIEITPYGEIVIQYFNDPFPPPNNGGYLYPREEAFLKYNKLI